ncbi:MAG: hypothetical protein LBU58_00955 [Clostridiales bacterium]|jgi:hypothetical protein|nr:hypothetical protein [Clostridiales bacterium]
MAKKEKAAKKRKTADADGAFAGESQKKGGGLVFAAVSLLSALLVIGAVLAGFLFFILRMNVLGVADTYRDAIEKVPVLNLALPKQEGEEADPAQMTFEDLVKRYDATVADKEKLEKDIEAANARVEELSRAKSEFDAQALINNEKTAQLEKKVADLEAEKKQLDDMKYDLERIAAEGDKAAFAKYFEGVSPEVAQEIYAQVMQEQKKSDETAEFLKTFQTLDTKAASQILETLGAVRIDFITETLRGLKRDIAADIIAQLTPELAAQVTLRLAGN